MRYPNRTGRQVTFASAAGLAGITFVASSPATTVVVTTLNDAALHGLSATAAAPSLALQPLVQVEAHAMPPDHRLWLDGDEGLSPTMPDL
jgi:hypothetical protein